MSVQAFDLGLRLRARHTGDVCRRLATTPFYQMGRKVAVTYSTKGVLTVQVENKSAAQGKGLEALNLLAPYIPKANPENQNPPTLVVADHKTLRGLLTLAAKASPGTQEFAVGNLIDWWAQRSEHPGNTECVIVVDFCRQMWVTGGEPDDERDAKTWVRWLNIETSGTKALLDIAQKLADGQPLPSMVSDSISDNGSWVRLRRDIDSGKDWRKHPGPKEAALGLRERSDMADWFDRVLMDDPIWRERAKISGYVVEGTLTSLNSNDSDYPVVSVTTEQGSCRLREGKEIEIGLSHGQKVSGKLRRFRTDANGHMVLEMSADKNQHFSLQNERGKKVDVAPTSVRRKNQRQMFMNYKNRFENRPWTLTRGAAPSIVTREVPDDVFLAGAAGE